MHLELRNEKDKNSSAVDGSILKSFKNQGFSFKEEKTGSGMESVSPCRVRADLWLNKGRSCRDSGKDLFRDVVVLHQQREDRSYLSKNYHKHHSFCGMKEASAHGALTETRVGKVCYFSP